MIRQGVNKAKKLNLHNFHTDSKSFYINLTFQFSPMYFEFFQLFCTSHCLTTMGITSVD